MEEFDAQDMLSSLAAQPGWLFQPSEIQLRISPWTPAAYSSVAAVQIKGADPDDLSPVQRQALMTYVKSGGTLMVVAPDAQLIQGSWLEPLLPVNLIGNRELKGITLPGGQQLPFRRYVPCTEAIAGDGEVLLADGQYVHLAYRVYGLGRIAFSSFPMSALAVAPERAGQIWSELISLRRPPVGVGGTELANTYAQLMEPMLGREAPARSIAMLAALGFVALVVVLHLVWRGATRPNAFTVSLIAAVLVCIIFAAAALVRVRGGSDPLQQARLDVVDASAQGSAVTEYSAVSGPQQTIGREVADPPATISLPVFHQDRPLLMQSPMQIERIDIQPQHANLVSLAELFEDQPRAGATGRFTDRGLQLQLSNQIGQTLQSVQFKWPSIVCLCRTFLKVIAKQSSGRSNSARPTSSPPHQALPRRMTSTKVRSSGPC